MIFWGQKYKGGEKGEEGDGEGERWREREMYILNQYTNLTKIL